MTTSPGSTGPSPALAAGTYRLGDVEVPRIGYGAMQLPGPGVMGPPRDRDEALAVLREAYDLGVRHVDTAQFYGPEVANELLREAYAPHGAWPKDLVVVTKVGAYRDDAGAWLHDLNPASLQRQVRENLETLGRDRVDVVNLRLEGAGDGHSPAATEPITPQVEALAALVEEGIVGHVGLSVATLDQLAEAQAVTPVACVQNFYNLVDRHDEELLAATREQGIAYVPFFPLGGFTPLQAAGLDQVAARLGATPMQVAQAWLLQRSDNLLLISGTSSTAHLRENVAAGSLVLDDEAVAALDALA